MNRTLRIDSLKRIFALVLFVMLLLCCAQAQAQTTATTGEKQIGVTSCANGSSSVDFDTVAQCNSITSSAGTFQKAPLFAGTVTSTPYAATTCTSSNYGMIQWTGTYFQACTTSGWINFIGANTASAFAFTNQTGVTASTTISSNAVTVSGFTGTLTATCGTGCTAIARNGVWGGTSVSGFASGDTIAIRQTSSASANTATTATVTLGTTVSATWTVTTASSNAPSAFSFTNQTGVGGSLTISSGDVALSGFTGTLTATCNPGCTGIAVNSGSGDVWGGTTASVTSGNSINIKMLSSSSANTAATASVTVGNTTSSTWTVTTGSDPCASVGTPGGVCTNGEIFAGISPDSGTKMFVTACDAYASGSHGSCGGGGGSAWNNGGTSYVATGFTNVSTGQTNTAGLVASTGNADYPYKNAVYCYNLTADTYSSGWYLPAINELNTIWSNATAIGGFDTGNNYWSSTDYAASTAYVLKFSTGVAVNYAPKVNGYVFRCARRL